MRQDTSKEERGGLTFGGPGLYGADYARPEQIELSAPIHLTFDELELGDLPFGSSVRPGRGDRGGNGRFILEDARGKGGDETRSRPLQPWIERNQASVDFR